MSEQFSQKRFDRVLSISRTILDFVGDDGHGTYTIRALEDIDGMPIAELRKQYFAVGVPGNLTEVPYFDMLTIVRVVSTLIVNLKNKGDKSQGEFTFEATTEFTEDQEWQILDLIHIDPPSKNGGSNSTDRST